MIKIAFFDIDGTLLQLGHKQMSAKTEYALNKLRENGVILCMATGRGVLNMPKFKNIQFDVCLTFNGSYCFTDEKVIFSNPLSRQDVLCILENTKKMKRAMAINNENILVANGTDDDLETYFSLFTR